MTRANSIHPRKAVVGDFPVAEARRAKPPGGSPSRRSGEHRDAAPMRASPRSVLLRKPDGRGKAQSPAAPDSPAATDLPRPTLLGDGRFLAPAGGPPRPAAREAGFRADPIQGPVRRMSNESSFIGPGSSRSRSRRAARDADLPAISRNHGAIVLAGDWLAREAPDVWPRSSPQSREPSSFFVVSSSRERALAIDALADRAYRRWPSGSFRFRSTPAGARLRPVRLESARAAAARFGRGLRPTGNANSTTARRPAIAGISKRGRPRPCDGGGTPSNGRGHPMSRRAVDQREHRIGHDVEAVAQFSKNGSAPSRSWCWSIWPARRQATSTCRRVSFRPTRS